MIEVVDLGKRYGSKTAVDGLSFTVEPGTVTGFLGPNGAGKTTTTRVLVGLAAPSAGFTTVNGKPYRAHRAPVRGIGVLFEACAVHPGRPARRPAHGGAGRTGQRPRPGRDQVGSGTC